MTFVLLVVGLLATAAGFVTLGFGISIHAFSLGNTLIVAGTVAVAAGLILIALAALLGQLRRIAEALNARPFSRAGLAAESVVESLAPPTARLTPAAAPQPPMPSMPTKMPDPPRPPRMFEAEAPHLPEPHFPVAPPAPSEQAPGPLDWLRAKPRPGAVAAAPMPPAPAPTEPSPAPAEPPMVDIRDEAPLSPRPPLRPAMPAAPEPALEPRAWSPARSNGAPQAMPRANPQPLPPTGAPERDKDGFDMVWPEPRTGAPEPAMREAAPEPAPMPPATVRQREEATPERRAEPAAPRPAPKPASERAPAILKSGVIDGMPYTLYADGSIEAELPQGVVKFASVDALRSHLEKQG